MAATAGPVMPVFGGLAPTQPAPQTRSRRAYWRQPLFVRSNFQLDDAEPGEFVRASSTRAIDVSTAHPQHQSPLYGVLPPELRNAIFDLALAQHEVTAHPYPAAHRASRPLYSSPRRVCLALLRTCRRAYAETAHIPLSGAYELTLWCGHDDAAPPESKRQAPHRASRTACPRGPWCGAGDGDGNSYTSPDEEALTPDAVRNARRQRFEAGAAAAPEQQQQGPRARPGRVHVFAQMWWLEQHRLTSLCKAWRVSARCVTLTVRHTDWRGWEAGAPLALQRGWLERWKLPASVCEFDLELETAERRKEELDAVVAEARGWPLTRRDGAVLSAAGAPKEFRWTGRRKSSGAVCSDGAVGAEDMGYYVVTLQWRVVEEA